jgi:hypothetical protein
LVADHRGRDVFGASEARDAAHEQHAVGFDERAGVDVDVRGTDTVSDFVDGEVVGFETRAVEAHLDLAVAPARHAHLGHAFELLERGPDLPIRDALELGEIRAAVGRHEPEREHGQLARIEAPHAHLVHVGVRGDGRHGLVDLDEREVDVGVPVERDARDELARACDLTDLAQAAYGEEQLLDALAVEPLHFDGRPLARRNRDEHGGALEIGQEVERQAAPRNVTEHDDDGREHGHGHGPAGCDACYGFHCGATRAFKDS